MRIDYGWIGMLPHSAVFSVVDLFGLTQHNLMRNGVLIIRLIVSEERIVSFV